MESHFTCRFGRVLINDNNNPYPACILDKSLCLLCKPDDYEYDKIVFRVCDLYEQNIFVKK